MKRRANGQIARATEQGPEEYAAALAERLRAKAKRKRNGCLVWTGAKTPNGYGQIRVRNPANRLLLAHRAAWMVAGNDAPGALDLCHKCDTPACIEVSHLFIGSRADNMRDMASKGRGGDTRGEKSGKAVLTRADILAIKKRRKKGEALCSIAKDYPVGAPHLSRICAGKRWAHTIRGKR